MTNRAEKAEIQFKLLQRNPAEETVPIPDEILSKLGWQSVKASQSADDNELHELIAELKTDEADHTWRWLHSDDTKGLANKLLKFENERRESIILYYYGEHLSGQRELFGAVAIAERVTKDFQHSGYPVIGRMYIRRKLRDLSLGFFLSFYQCVLISKTFGESLMGVHVGTSNPKIFAKLHKEEKYGKHYRHIGNKKLEGKDTHIVRAYFSPTKNILDPLKRLQDILITKSDPNNKLCGVIQEFLDNRTDETFYYKLKNSAADFEKMTGFLPRSDLVFDQFLELLKEIKVDEISEIGRTN